MKRLWRWLTSSICPARGQIDGASADEAIAVAPEPRPARPAHRPMARIRRRMVSPFGQGPGRTRRRGPSRPTNRLSR